MAYVLNVENNTTTEERDAILNATGSDLRDAAQSMIDDYFEKNRHSGATCDFGGVAFLLEENRTLYDDDSYYNTDDEYFGLVTQSAPINKVYLVLGGILASLIGALVGFILAMRFSSGFNRRVRSMPVFEPLAKSKSQILRSSLNLPMLEDYDEISNFVQEEDLAKLIQDAERDQHGDHPHTF